jgi:hypothetical protein
MTRILMITGILSILCPAISFAGDAPFTPAQRLATHASTDVDAVSRFHNLIHGNQMAQACGVRNQRCENVVCCAGLGCSSQL